MVLPYLLSLSICKIMVLSSSLRSLRRFQRCRGKLKKFGNPPPPIIGVIVLNVTALIFHRISSRPIWFKGNKQQNALHIFWWMKRCVNDNKWHNASCRHAFKSEKIWQAEEKRRNKNTEPSTPPNSPLHPSTITNQSEATVLAAVYTSHQLWCLQRLSERAN